MYERENRCGWHLEWWLHVGGCRKLLGCRLYIKTLAGQIVGNGTPQARIGNEVGGIGRVVRGAGEVVVLQPVAGGGRYAIDGRPGARSGLDGTV